MSKLQVGDRIFVSVECGWDEKWTNVYGCTGTIATKSSWLPGYGVILDIEKDREFGDIPAHFFPDEVSSLSEYNTWVDDVISGEADAPEYIK